MQSGKGASNRLHDRHAARPLEVFLRVHGISRLPDIDGDKPEKRRFKTHPIGYFHIDIAKVRTEQDKLHLFVAIDRTSKLAFVELHEKATTRVSADFLGRLLAALPYKVHAVLTDNGIQFTPPGTGGSAVPLIREAMAKGELFRAHALSIPVRRPASIIAQPGLGIPGPMARSSA